MRAFDLGTCGRTMALGMTRDCLSEKGQALRSLVRAKAGTILFPKSGAAVATNNRALLSIEAAFVSHLMGVEPGPMLDSRWAYHWLSTIDMREHSDNEAYPSIKQSVAQRIKIPLPPLAEQRRIAGRLEAALMEVAAAGAATSQALKAASQLRAAAFAEAVTEGGWPNAPLIELCEGKGKYGLSVKAHPEPRGFPLLRMGNIQHGRLDLADLAYVELSEEEYEDYAVRAGDVIFNRTNSAELVGKTAYVEEDTNAVFASYLVRFRADREKADPRFLAQVINSPIGRAYIEQHMGRAVGQVNISAGKMHDFPVPCPPLARQRQIMARVYEVSAVANNTLSDLRSQSAALDALPASLLSAAFRGEL